MMPAPWFKGRIVSIGDTVNALPVVPVLVLKMRWCWLMKLLTKQRWMKHCMASRRAVMSAARW